MRLFKGGMAIPSYCWTSVTHGLLAIVSLSVGHYIWLLHNLSTTSIVLSDINGTTSIVLSVANGPTTAAPDLQVSDETLQERVEEPVAKKEITIRDPLYVGVVTAANFLQTRVLTVNGTWGHKAPKLEYFASEGERKHDLPVVSLPGVDDTYPPQKKVFRMWKYIHDNYIDQYNWFLRADDDLYVRIPKLIQFLSKLDPTKDLYIGSPGYGKPEDKKRIKLYHNERYCMGGPGVILSRALLKKLVPHLDECLENVVVSYNEDVELGRCISRRLGVQCTWALEMRSIFNHNEKNVKVYNQDGITFHPFKTKESMYHIHEFFLEVSAKEAIKTAKSLNAELENLTKYTLAKD